MPSTFTSPYATSFKNACKRGTSWNVAVHNIANRCKKSPSVVWNSLFKAGLCHRQKFNGQWVYWPCDTKKFNATNCKTTQTNCWQWYCEWCIGSGHCTPEQMHNHCGSQKAFMTWCRKFFGKQFTTTTNTKSRPRKTYKFPTTRTKTRTYRRAA